MMGRACATISWMTPEQFWRSTPHELQSILEAQEDIDADTGNA